MQEEQVLVPLALRLPLGVRLSGPNNSATILDPNRWHPCQSPGAGSRHTDRILPGCRPSPSRRAGTASAPAPSRGKG